MSDPNEIDLPEAEEIGGDGGDPALWANFRRYLVEKQQIQPLTAEAYATQVRRVLRCVNPLEESALNEWVRQFPAKRRTPLRASWRKFRLFYLDTFHITLPDFTKGGGELTAEALNALWVCVQGHKIKPQVLCTLTINVNTEPKFVNLWPGVAGGSLVLVQSADGVPGATIPAEAYKALVKWGRQTQRLVGPPWLVPATPGGEKAMTPLQIAQALRKV